MEKINIDLLKKLCEINHPSGKEHSMVTFILNFCYKISGISFELDDYNNLFITKNTTNPDTYACLVSHMDEIFTHTDVKVARIKKNKIYGYYKNSKRQCGLGLDDSFGIYICLHCLVLFPNLKVCFTTKEERGCIGAERASLNVDFFDDCRYLLQADRHGNSDLITHTNGMNVTSEEFLSDIAPLMDKYHYTKEIGTMTDIGTLKENINLSAVNISCGYYREHTDHEYGDLIAFRNCLNFIVDIINLNDKVYPHTSILDYPTYYHYSRDEYDYYNTLAKNCTTCIDYDCMNCPYYKAF